MTPKFIKILAIFSIAMLLSSCTKIGLVDLTAMLRNLYSQLEAVWKFLFAFSYVAGICFITIAILKLKQYGQMTVMMSTHAAMGPTIAYLVVGIGLLFLPTFMDTLSWTFWGYSYETGIELANAEVVNFADVIQPMFRLVMVLGLISLIRGWIMLARLGQQGSPPGTMSKGIMHIIGGIAAININGTITILKETFGLI